MPDMTVRQWLDQYGDWLGFSQLIALMVGSVVGFMRRSKGLAILFTHVAAAVTAIILFMLGVGREYNIILVAVTSGVIGGGLGMALFGVLVALSDRLDARRGEIADKIIDKVPIAGDSKND